MQLNVAQIISRTGIKSQHDFLIWWCFWLMTGCTSTYPAIPHELKQAITPNLTFKQVIEDPRSYVGKTVLWGGTIFKTTVRKNGTFLEIIQKPLDAIDRPLATDASLGRFLVERSHAFLDPAIFEKGRAVTVIGTITKKEVRQLGELDYPYPYIVATHIYLWPTQLFAPGWPYWGYPYGVGNFYGPYPYGFGTFGGRRFWGTYY